MSGTHCVACCNGERRQVHEIQPGYSREDFALPGRVGLVAEVGGRALI